MSRIVSNTRAAIPGVLRRPSPTTQMMARRGCTCTSPSASSSATTAGRRAASSTVRETLTSEVATTSTGSSWRSNTSNRARKNP